MNIKAKKITFAPLNTFCHPEFIFGMTELVRHDNYSTVVKKRLRGFGILEVLISAVIIIIMLSALVLLARNAINNAQYVQERIQAVSLAGEGVEIVRQIRDSNYVDGKNTTQWNSMVKKLNNLDPFVTGKDYYIKYDSLAFIYQFCLTTTPTDGLTTINEVDFNRKITFTDISGSNVLKLPSDVSNLGENAVVVTATVSWSSRGASHSIEIKELLANSRFQF